MGIPEAGTASSPLARLEALEQQVGGLRDEVNGWRHRWWMLKVVGIPVAAAGFFLVVAMGVGGAVRRNEGEVGPKNPSWDTVTAKAFFLETTGDKRTGVFGLDRGRPVLLMYDERGEERIRVGCENFGAPWMRMMSPNGKGSAFISAGYGGPKITLVGPELGDRVVYTTPHGPRD